MSASRFTWDMADLDDLEFDDDGDDPERTDADWSEELHPRGEAGRFGSGGGGQATPDNPNVRPVPEVKLKAYQAAAGEHAAKLEQHMAALHPMHEKAVQDIHRLSALADHGSGREISTFGSEEYGHAMTLGRDAALNLRAASSGSPLEYNTERLAQHEYHGGEHDGVFDMKQREARAAFLSEAPAAVAHLEKLHAEQKSAVETMAGHRALGKLNAKAENEANDRDANDDPRNIDPAIKADYARASKQADARGEDVSPDHPYHAAHEAALQHGYDEAERRADLAPHHMEDAHGTMRDAAAYTRQTISAIQKTADKIGAKQARRAIQEKAVGERMEAIRAHWLEQKPDAKINETRLRNAAAEDLHLEKQYPDGHPDYKRQPWWGAKK